MTNVLILKVFFFFNLAWPNMAKFSQMMCVQSDTSFEGMNYVILMILVKTKVLISCMVMAS